MSRTVTQALAEVSTLLVGLASPSSTTVVVPVGSLAQHGPHLPLGTDTLVAVAVAERVAARLGGNGREVWVAPPVAYGVSGEHQGFPGTTSVGTEVLGLVLVELVCSLATWCTRVVLVNGHGGNDTAVETATAQLRDQGHDVQWLACVAAGADLHAGHAETSLVLHLAPWSVRRDRMVVGDLRTADELRPLLREHGVAAVSPSGVLGDPRGATAEQGARLLDQMVRNALAGLKARDLTSARCPPASVPANPS